MSDNRGPQLSVSRSGARPAQPACTRYASSESVIATRPPGSATGGASTNHDNTLQGVVRRLQNTCRCWEPVFLLWATLITTFLVLLLVTLLFTSARGGEATGATISRNHQQRHQKPESRSRSNVAGIPYGNKSTKGTASGTMAAASFAANLEKAQSTTKQRPRVLLFGDSITERSFDVGGWGARLAHNLQRRVDVVNRGFGGYNSKWAAYMLPEVLNSCLGSRITLATVFFGANDAASATAGAAAQHVPVPEYVTNLRLIVKYLQARGVQRIVLLTPPPIHAEGRRRHHGPASVGRPLDRTYELSQEYAQAAVEEAARLGVPSVDLWHGLQDIDSWGPTYLCDGLHLTAEGNRRLFDLLRATLDERYPEISMETMPIHFPEWADINVGDPAITFGKLDPALHLGMEATAEAAAPQSPHP